MRFLINTGLEIMLPFDNAILITAPFNEMLTVAFILNLCYCQSNAWHPLLASDYCRACGNQIIEPSSDNKTVLSSSRNLEGATQYLIDGSEEHISRLSFH